MWKTGALVLLVAGFVSSRTCPDGKICSLLQTCCLTNRGYACCPVPNAVCCADKTHCCPVGYRCNAITKMCEKAGLPWDSLPLLQKVAAEAPSSPALPAAPLGEASESSSPLVQSSGAEDATVVHCDNYYTCPSGTTCCRHPKGPWFCCPYSPGKCCLDGYHCCPYGYDCDYTYTKCVRDGLRYPFPQTVASPSVPATEVRSLPESQVNEEQVPLTALSPASDTDGPQSGVIRCDSVFFCPSGTSCCKGPTGKWGCCQYPLGQCCADGLHCCEYGYNCDPSFTTCRKWYSQVPSSLKKDAAKQD